MGFSTDLIKGPVGRTLGLIVWMVVFSLFLGAINGWYLQASTACVVAGERFDRVVQKGALTADDTWANVTAVVAADATAAVQSGTLAYMLAKPSSGTMCQTNVTSTATTTATAFYTPLGTEVSAGASDATDPFTISGGSYEDAGAIFITGGLSGLVKILLQAGGLAPPLALLLALGSFGQSFMQKVGAHPIMAAIAMAITLLLVATLLNTFVPFLEGAFLAIDSNRFAMYDEGLGSLSVVIGNFFGVVIVAGMMMIAWQMLKSMRGGDAIGGSQQM